MSTNYSYPTLVHPDINRITGTWPCHYCHLPVGHRQASVIFGLNKAAVIGAAHLECSYFDLQHAQFTITRPTFLNPAETGFLAHFYTRLFVLPGQGNTNAALRHLLAGLLSDYPAALNQLTVMIKQFMQENRAETQVYGGDLEKDCYDFLGQVQKAARAAPLDCEIDLQTL